MNSHQLQRSTFCSDVESELCWAVQWPRACTGVRAGVMGVHHEEGENPLQVPAEKLHHTWVFLGWFLWVAGLGFFFTNVADTASSSPELLLG